MENEIKKLIAEKESLQWRMITAKEDLIQDRNPESEKKFVDCFLELDSVSKKLSGLELKRFREQFG